MVFNNFQEIVVAPYFNVTCQNVQIQRSFVWRLSKDFRKVSKRNKILFFGFLEIKSSTNENRWDVHPIVHVRLHYILTKRRKEECFMGDLRFTVFFVTWLWSLLIRGEAYALIHFIAYHGLLSIHDSFYSWICWIIQPFCNTIKIFSWSCTIVCIALTNVCSILCIPSMRSTCWLVLCGPNTELHFVFK